MVKLIQQFVGCCRASGMRISTSEVLDSLKQMRLIDPTDEQQFRSLLRSNFAKSMRDVQHFDRLYHLFSMKCTWKCPICDRRLIIPSR